MNKPDPNAVNAAIAAILAVRTGGLVTCAVLDYPLQTIGESARAFELLDGPGIYDPISVERALDIMTNVIHKGLAYNVEYTTRAHAQALAENLLALVHGPRAAYFTNGYLGWTEEPPVRYGRSWSPATYSTFDTGVLMLGTRATACLWVEDED